MPQGKVHPWIEWEIEYINSEQKKFADRTDFFREKNVKQSVWSPKTKDWDEKRMVALRESQKLALSRNIEKKARFIEKSMSLGDALMSIGGQALVAKNDKGQSTLKVKSLKEAAEIIEKGSELMKSGLQLDQSAELMQALQVNIQLNNQQGKIDGVDSKTLRIMAKTFGKSKNALGAGRRSSVDVQQD